MLRLCTYLWLAALLPIIGYGQENRSFEEFDFVYVDNSMPTVNDGLTDSLVAILIDRLAAVKANPGNGVAFFISNGAKYTFVSQSNELDLGNIQRNLFSVSTAYPQDLVKESKRVRSVLLQSPTEVKKAVRFHFFVSNFFCNRLETQPALLTHLVPKQFISLNKLETVPAELNIYFADDQQNIDYERVRSNFNFPLVSQESSIDKSITKKYKCLTTRLKSD